MSRKINLGIETAIGGGSISIYENGRELDFLYNLNARSTAEDLILLIDKLLVKNCLGKQEIGKILYSGGPGSQTGIRIGAATAKALACALNCECLKVGLLYALTFYTKQRGFIQTAIQMSDNEFCLQMFEKTEIIVAKNPSERISKDDLISRISNLKCQQTIVVVKKDIGELKSNTAADNLIILEKQNNFARLLNLSAFI